MTENLIWFSHMVFAFTMIALSWARSRHILHPHFVLTGIFTFFLSDYLIRGYRLGDGLALAGQGIDHIDQTDLIFYQMIIMASIGLTILLSATVRVPKFERNRESIRIDLAPSEKLQSFVLTFALAVIAMELTKRLFSVGWSIGDVFQQSLGPRGMRDWDQAQFRGNAIFALISAVQPLGASTAAYLTITGSRVKRLSAFVVMLLSLSMLITDGSRTPAVIVIASAWFVAMLRYRRLASRVTITFIFVLIMAFVTSVMIIYRGTGYISTSSNRIDFRLTYHQDDNYYRALNAMNYADHSSLRWDASEFFSAIVANPVPRAIWPGKPLLTENFWGGYKLWWVTISSYGESAALFGILGGILFVTLVNFVMYLILVRAVSLLSKPMGLVAYILVCLYVYMILRSLLNLTHFMYLPIFAITLTWVLSKAYKRVNSNKTNYLEYPRA